MNTGELRLYLLNKPEAFEDYPFGPRVAVMKVRSKMFATLVEDEGGVSMNLKCDPHEALILRDIFPAVTPGYHMNKRHWNTLLLDGSIPRGELERMMDNSYALVVRGPSKTARQSLEICYGRAALYPGAET
jgi:predicted DNA-binding protein (MmcQ/YjbR family)